jgi:dTDP-4-amino-4,6-dideoxygalactose transaminase
VRNIPIAQPQIGWAERRAVGKVLKSGSLAQGPMVAKFEREFSKFVGHRECVAVNSGTSALHLALLSLGIGPGDEVIVPSFTFAATANSVALTGAKPVFVDIDPKTYNINPSLIESAISKRTKAIQVVHLYGLPADMSKILEIARKHNLLIVEDAAQAHLAEIFGQRVGTFGDAAAFSFYPTKNMTSGEGGMIVFKDSDLARTSRLLRNQGMEKRYQNELIGFNLRMTDIHAAIGVEQLKKIEKRTYLRIRNAEFLSSRLQQDITPFTPEGTKHVFHQYTVRLNSNRDLISTKLNDLGIGNSIYYPTQVHKLPSFQSDLELEQTKLATEQVLSLPIHPSLSKRDLRRISDSLIRLMDEYL